MQHSALYYFNKCVCFKKKLKNDCVSPIFPSAALNGNYKMKVFDNSVHSPPVRLSIEYQIWHIFTCFHSPVHKRCDLRAPAFLTYNSLSLLALDTSIQLSVFQNLCPSAFASGFHFPLVRMTYMAAWYFIHCERFIAQWRVSNEIRRASLSDDMSPSLLAARVLQNIESRGRKCKMNVMNKLI